MRVCIIGGGLAGSMLAWRLTRATSHWQIDLVHGQQWPADATAVSGGAVRTYETHAEQRRLAILSMLELLGSRTLREWSGYQPGSSAYLRPASAGLDAELAEIEQLLPGSCHLADPTELARQGWAEVPEQAVAVVERHAGHVSPAQLRASVLADEAMRRRVCVRTGTVTSITASGGHVMCEVNGERQTYDQVVIATGAWTSALLASCGFVATGYRTKSIQYSLYPIKDWCPPQFVDEFTGLFGRPAEPGSLLLGVPTDQWGVDPDRPPTTVHLHDHAAQLARIRFPALELGPASKQVGSADCYADQPVLSLRQVSGTDHGLFTFSGGAGGSVKTVLAASQRAAIQLVESDPSLN
ncbi:MAG TPA: FAD-dependent oxidoreductase [Micromonosporaceae bacterium]